MLVGDPADLALELPLDHHDLLAGCGGAGDALPEPIVDTEDERWRAQTRRRWAQLTQDLHSYCRDWTVAEDATGDGEEKEELPPLDVPSQDLEDVLLPCRTSELQRVEQLLAFYDSSDSLPRPQDVRFECRDGYEEHLYKEVLSKLRSAIERQHRNRKGKGSGSSSGSGSSGGIAGQQPHRTRWQVVGGTGAGGIIVRAEEEISSPKADSRLSTGAFIEQLAIAGERLQYRLVKGTGPVTGWVSVSVRVGDEEKPLVVRATEADVDGILKAPAQRPEILVIGLMAVHISTEARLRRLKHVLLSVGRQEITRHELFLFAVSWSASTPELEAKVQRAMADLELQRDPNIDVVTVRAPQRRSQFQHLRAALHAAEAKAREGPNSERAWGSVWVVFGDDDDVWHRRRVAEYVGAIRSHWMLDGVAVFATTTRANCHENCQLADRDLPTNEEEVDRFLRRGLGQRMDRQDPAVRWRHQLRQEGLDGCLLPIPQEIGLEYFDFCPRLRLVHEFFERTSLGFLEHRLCDLRFTEFLSTYPRMGREMGLEVSFFDPRCWMLFYATPIASWGQWERSVEGPSGVGQGSEALDVNNGHMSTTLGLQQAEQELAQRVCEEFREYEEHITPHRLARYWAAFRNTLEMYLVRKHQCRIDQRVFDVFVFLAINNSFFKFAERLGRMPNQAKAETAERMMYYVGQGFGKALVAALGVSVLWVKPEIFVGRDFYYSSYGLAVPLLGGTASFNKMVKHM